MSLTFSDSWLGYFDNHTVNKKNTLIVNMTYLKFVHINNLRIFESFTLLMYEYCQVKREQYNTDFHNNVFIEPQILWTPLLLGEY